jgi:type VI secretion system protein VasD
VKDGSVAVTKAVFETKVKQMDLVVTARGALNQDARGKSLSVRFVVSANRMEITQ